MTFKQYLHNYKREPIESHKYSYDELKIFGIISLHDSERQLLDIEDMCLLAIKICELWNTAYEVYEEKLYDFLIDENDELKIQNSSEADYSQVYADRICDLIIDTFAMED